MEDGMVAPMRLLACFLLLVMNAVGATYYVDPDTGNDASAGTATGTAWAHIPGAIGVSGAGWVQLVNGDTLLVKGGTTNNYQVKMMPDYFLGHSNFNSILIQSGHLASWGSGRAIIDGQSNRTYGVWFSGNGSGSLDGVTFDGFEVREILQGGPGAGFDTSAGSSCLVVGGNYPTTFLTIKRCYLHHAYPGTGDDKGHGIEFSASTNFIITQNIIGPYIGTKGVEPYRANRGVISNNFFYGCADHCISLTTCTNIDVCNNVIFNMPVPVYKHQPQYGISVSGAQWCDVWNNLIYRTKEVTNLSAMYWGQGISQYTDCISNRVMFNTIAYFGDYNSGGGSTAIRVGESSNPSKTNKGYVFHNNIVASNWNFFGSSYIVYTNTVGGESVRYNCFFGTNGTTGNVMAWSDAVTHYYTNVAGYNPGSGSYSNNLQVAPIFFGGALPDGLDENFQPNQPYFSLSTNGNVSIRVTPNRPIGVSPYGYDTNPEKFNIDIAGNTRTAFSIGAYELVGSTPKTVIHGKSRLGGKSGR